jgi:hypothetical protein
VQVADSFHVVCAVNRTVDAVRRWVQNEQFRHRSSKEDQPFKIRKRLQKGAGVPISRDAQGCRSDCAADEDELPTAWLAKKSPATCT